MANNTANVSTTRGVQGGYIFRAALTAIGPTTYSWTPGAGWECLGYIPEDGFTESVSSDSNTSLRDINLDLVDEVAGSFTETLEVGLMEIAANPLSTIYGSENVTDSAGLLKVEHNWSKSEEEMQYVLLLLLKNDRKWVKHIPKAKVTDRGDFTGNKTTAAQRTVTLTYLNDANGTGCVDYIQSTETPVPQLTTLTVTGTGITLSPTFAAGTHAYTATTTGNTATVTATSTGNTVSIKCGANTYSSGSAVPLVTGTNVIVVTVTEPTFSTTSDYTITITK